MFELNTNFELYYFTSFIGYPVLGYYLANKDFKISDKKMSICGLCILALSLICYIYLDFNHINMGPLYQNLTNVFLAIGLFLLIEYIDKLGLFTKIKDSLIGSAITSISICSYGMFFVHFILYKFFDQFNIHSFKIVPIMLIIIVFLSWFIIYLLNKIPHLNKFIGV